jgi:hypothetical protein
MVQPRYEHFTDCLGLGEGGGGGGNGNMSTQRLVHWRLPLKLGTSVQKVFTNSLQFILTKTVKTSLSATLVIFNN